MQLTVCAKKWKRRAQPFSDHLQAAKANLIKPTANLRTGTLHTHYCILHTRVPLRQKGDEERAAQMLISTIWENNLPDLRVQSYQRRFLNSIHMTEQHAGAKGEKHSMEG